MLKIPASDPRNREHRPSRGFIMPGSRVTVPRFRQHYQLLGGAPSACPVTAPGDQDTVVFGKARTIALRYSRSKSPPNPGHSYDGRRSRKGNCIGGVQRSSDSVSHTHRYPLQASNVPASGYGSRRSLRAGDQRSHETTGDSGFRFCSDPMHSDLQQAKRSALRRACLARRGAGKRTSD